MPDPFMAHVTENWRMYAFIGSVGGFGTLIRVHSRNISKLWDVKQDKAICVNEHKHVTETLDRIEKNVEYLVRKNGG